MNGVEGDAAIEVFKRKWIYYLYVTALRKDHRLIRLRTLVFTVKPVSPPESLVVSCSTQAHCLE